MLQFPGLGKKPPQGVVFDSDFGNTIDSVLALALLHGFDGKNEARVASVSVSKSNLRAAQLCDVVEKFYASATTGIAAQVFRGLPIGLSVEGKMPDDTPILTGTLTKTNSDGKPVYAPRIQTLNDTAIVEALIRNALTAQHDGNAVVVLAGPATNLVRALDLRGTKDLIARKVKFLSMVGGVLPSGQPDLYFTADIPAARRLFAEWPTPIVISGREIGTAVPFPASCIEKDFAYDPAHPIADAYRACKPMPYDAPTWDMAAVLYAVRPQEGYFKLSDPGTISVTGDGQVVHTSSADGRHRYLIFDPEQKERITKVYTELASAKPVAKVFRPPVQEKKDEDKDDEKQEDKKQDDKND
jgi:inosine-uridine nucleoside N-ribohydrolase